MAKSKSKRGDRSAFSFDMARDYPLATAAAVGGTVAAGVFLWARRNQISEQLSNLSDQIGEWRSGNMDEIDEAGDETTTSASRPASVRRRNRRKADVSAAGGTTTS